MKVDLSEIEKKTVSVDEYLKDIKKPFREKFLTTKQTYQLKEEVIIQLKKIADRYVVIAFSAEWCKDCAANVPVLALISKEVGLEVRVFGGLMMDALNPDRIWRIPPSPPEVEVLNVEFAPTFLIFDKKGNEIGRIIENPKFEQTIEQEINEIIKRVREGETVLTL